MTTDTWEQVITKSAQRVGSWNENFQDSIEWAILQTVAYSDVFDYPLTPGEIHRNLIGRATSPESVLQALRYGRWAPRYLTHRNGYYTLPGREAIVDTRQRRAEIAATMWPKAYYYGKLIAMLPFTKMVALTGALAVDNVESEADLDYLIVTEPGRLWLCRAMVILLVRWAATHSVIVCPNSFLSETKLVITRRDLYSAHEMIQMVPIAGLDVYHRMISLNSWTQEYLPNAHGPSRIEAEPSYSKPFHRLKDFAEGTLRAPWANGLERWEMNRKVRKFNQRKDWTSEADFCADWCKGYFDAHEHRTLTAFAERLHTIEEMVWLKP